MNMAFFYIQNTMAATNGVLFPAMMNIRSKSKNYNPSWVIFNQPVHASGSERLKPAVLIVADELFMMADASLQAKARLSVPSTYRDNKPGQTDRPDKLKSKEAWSNNMNCVQQHCFNNFFENVDTTVYDYLLSFSHEIISFKMMDRLVEYWNSNKIDWHLDRGLKVNTDGSALNNPNARGVSSQLFMGMAKYQKQ